MKSVFLLTDGCSSIFDDLLDGVLKKWLSVLPSDVLTDGVEKTGLAGKLVKGTALVMMLRNLFLISGDECTFIVELYRSGVVGVWLGE
jgi:hypothetical protein